MKCFNPCLVHPVALAINKKNEPPLFATVFVVYEMLFCTSLEILPLSRHLAAVNEAKYV
jgi:hypothetical protein